MLCAQGWRQRRVARGAPRAPLCSFARSLTSAVLAAAAAAAAAAIAHPHLHPPARQVNGANGGGHGRSGSGDRRAGAAPSGALYIGPLACTAPDCPSGDNYGRPVNNTNFHLRDIQIAWGGDGYYYLTGTSTSAGDVYWTDAHAVVRLWRSRSLTPGSLTGGGVVFNATRDCPSCSAACKTANSCRTCGGGNATCATPDGESCGARLWAPEFHFLPAKADAVAGSGGYFITYHMHCAGGHSGVLRSTSGTALGPYAPLVSGVPGGDVSLFQDPADGSVFALSSGGCISASLLSEDMARVVNSTCVSSECGDADCASTAIGFEGPFVIEVNGTYFLSSSAFGNATEHGGPASPFNKGPHIPPDSHYSSFMGRSSRLLGPYTNGRGRPGSWLAVDNGGHNAYFRGRGRDGEPDGTLWATVWYGSDPAGNTPPAGVGLVDLPSIIEVVVVDGRLVERSNILG